MRNQFADTFYSAACADERLALVVADISPAGSIEKFRTHFPDRFINTGVSEQIMVGMAAGLAIAGMKPFVYTIATFSLYRPFEFIRDDLCYQQLPVTIVGIGAGLLYSSLGATHHALEDVAIASAIPGMRVLAPCDPVETASAVEYCIQQNSGPIYLRLGKAGEPTLTESAVDEFQAGKVRCIQQGQDILFISYGPTLRLALELAHAYEIESKCRPTVLNCHTLKPLDEEGLLRAMSQHKKVVVLEEHVYQGGLGQQLKALAYGLTQRPEIHALSLKNEFIHAYGSHSDLLAKHGLSVEQMLPGLLTEAS